MRRTDIRFSSQRQIIASTGDCGEKKRRKAARRRDGGLAVVWVLLAGDGPQVFSLSRGQLESKGCRCHCAKSQRGLEELLNQKQFDIVLTTHRIEGNSTDWLGAALSGSRATLFYALPVEVGCWWVPVLRVGAECFGAPALRPREFSDALDKLVEEIRGSSEQKSDVRPVRAAMQPLQAKAKSNVPTTVVGPRGLHAAQVRKDRVNNRPPTASPSSARAGAERHRSVSALKPVIARSGI